MLFSPPKLLICLAFVLTVSNVGAQEANEVRVLSYNIRYLNSHDGDDIWSNRIEAVVSTLKNADILGLQEVVAEQLEDIRSRTTGYSWYAVARNDGKQEGESVPIGWNHAKFESLEKGTFWLSPTPDVVGSQGWDAALPRIASWIRLRDKRTQQVWIVVNTHFDHRGSEARKQSAALIRDWIAQNAQDCPTVLLGDFNATLKSAPLDTLLAQTDERSPLVLARKISDKLDPGPDSTWNGFRKIEPGRRIDHILMTSGVEVSEFHTLNPQTSQGRFASDHLPILAVLKASN